MSDNLETGVLQAIVAFLVERGDDAKAADAKARKHLAAATSVVKAAFKDKQETSRDDFDAWQKAFTQDLKRWALATIH